MNNESEFLANMSHEIRTPMSAILGMAEIAMRKNTNPEICDNLNNIMSAGKQLLSIINDILDYSKIEAGYSRTTNEIYDVNSMINDIVSMVYVRVGSKPIEIIIDDDPGLPREFIGDVTGIKQVITNLLMNAIKFTYEGHIILSVNAEPTDIKDMYKFNVSVTDTGIGIKEENLPNLFDNFTRFNTRKNRSTEGTGLGLAITKKLIELMRGKIHVKSVYGKGSCFSFYIPQKVHNAEPMFIPSKYKAANIAIRFSNPAKSFIIKTKLEKMGIRCKSISSFENISHYTHIMFDYKWSKEARESAGINTRLIAVTGAHSRFDNKMKGIKIFDMPLTNYRIIRLLDGFTDFCDKYDLTSNSIKLYNTRFLVVDDIDINLLITKEALKLYGGTVDTETSGLRAVEKVQTRNYDIIFMDHMMPELDGVDTTKLIRALPEEKYKKLPIVALTANVVGDVRNMFIESGMNDYLSKPLEQRDIERVLLEWLPPDKCTKLPSLRGA